VIHGLGGSGKTTLALEAAFAAQQRGVETWWVRATDVGSLVAGMRAVGRRVGAAQEDLERGDGADVLWQRLAVREQPWLLVIDGADDPRMLSEAGDTVADGRGWLRPVTGRVGLVLVTSRDGGGTSWGAWCRRVRLGMLPITEAAAVLSDHAGRSSRLGGTDEARMLAMRLGGFPLALKLAGSYLARSTDIPASFTDAGTITTYQGYRDAMNAGLAGAAGALHDEDITQVEISTLIHKARELTLDLLDARQLPEARRVLQLLAIFADAPLPYELILSPETLAASRTFSGITGSRLWRAIATLDDFGLLELSVATPESAEVGVVRLHPLVRDASYPPVDSGYRVSFLELASRLLDRAVRDQVPEEAAAWPNFQLFAPHIEEVFKAIELEPRCRDKAVTSVVRAALKSARYWARQGFRIQPEALTRAAFEAQTRILGADHPTTLATRHQLAHMIADRGNHATAEAEHRAVLEAETRILGPDHPSTLMTRHCLAHEIAERGDHVTAEAEHRAVIEAETRILGPDHPSTLMTRHCLASEIAEREDYATAEAEFREVLAARTRILGPDHRSTLATRLQLAHVISARGDYATAEAEYQAVRATQARVLNTDHPSILATRDEIAREIADRGDYATAEAEFREVLAARTRILGADHPITLTTRHRLAHAIAAQGDHATAEAEHRAVLEAQTRILGPDNPTTLTTRHCLAHEIAARGDCAKAIAEHRAVLEAQTRILGPDHSTTLRIRYCLAGEFAASGDYAAAEAEFREVLAARTRILGPDTPITLTTRHRLAHAIAAQGDHATAKAEHQAVLEAETRLLGPDHLSTLAIRYCVADELAASGDYAAAEAEFHEVLAARTRILGPDNPRTLVVRRSLATVCKAAGRREEAMSLYASLLKDCERALGAEHSLTKSVRSRTADSSPLPVVQGTEKSSPEETSPRVLGVPALMSPAACLVRWPGGAVGRPGEVACPVRGAEPRGSTCYWAALKRAYGSSHRCGLDTDIWTGGMNCGQLTRVITR